MKTSFPLSFGRQSRCFGPPHPFGAGRAVRFPFPVCPPVSICGVHARRGRPAGRRCPDRRRKRSVCGARTAAAGKHSRFPLFPARNTQPKSNIYSITACSQEIKRKIKEKSHFIHKMFKSVEKGMPPGQGLRSKSSRRACRPGCAPAVSRKNQTSFRYRTP